MSLERIFSDENILAYSQACIDLCERLPVVRSTKHDFDTLVIPSRGAVPFFLGLVHASDKLRVFGYDFEKFYREMGVDDMLAPLLPNDTKVSKKVNGKEVRVLLAPFTADLNIPKFDREADNDEYTADTRRYWANVMASFFKESKDRIEDPYFKTFTETILKDIEHRKRVAEQYMIFPSIGKFAMIDTVISGRASNDILRSFDDLAKTHNNPNLKPFGFLVVDENGTKLEKKKFRPYLRTKEARGQVEMFTIPRIVSEDEGAALEGVVASIYPSVMCASRDLVLDGKPFFVGAGSWHILPKNPYMDAFRSFMNLIYAGIDLKLQRDYDIGRGDEESRYAKRRQEFGETLESMRDLLSYNAAVTSRDLKIGYKPVDDYSTGSFVMHLPFNRESTNAIINNICSATGAIRANLTPSNQQ